MGRVGFRPVLLGALVTGAVAVAVLTEVPEPAQLRCGVAAAGPAAPAVFALVFAAATLVPLPKNVFAATAGLLFGLPTGVVVVVLGALLGALVAFGLGRVLGRESVERIADTRVARVDALLRRRGLLAVLAVRLVPVVPFTAVNYAAGLTAVRPRDYAIGTAIGIVPGTVSFVALGAYGTAPGSWPVALAVLVLVALTLAGAAAARRRER